MSYDVDGAAGTELITIQEKNGSEESKSSTLLRFTPVMLVNHEDRLAQCKFRECKLLGHLIAYSQAEIGVVFIAELTPRCIQYRYNKSNKAVVSRFKVGTS